MSNENLSKNIKEDLPKITKIEKCGIIMPISAIDGCTESHWEDVKMILCQSIQEIGFEPSLVSSSDDVGIIQKNIIQNLYDNSIVVCDVSGKNPNVMFELGIRLAFDKATIIVKDDKTTYSFDTSPIEHITYPRDLRFPKILEFKKELADKIKGTVSKSKTDPNYSTFLKHFGKFMVAKLETTEVSKEEYIINEIKDLRFIFQKYMNRDMNYRIGRTEENDSKHTACETALLNILHTTLKKYGPKIRHMPIANVVNLISEEIQMQNIEELKCYDQDNELCSKKIRDLLLSIIK